MVTTPRLTYQDYADLQGDERYELLDGVLVLLASPNEAHQTVSLRLASRIHAFAKEHELGKVLHAPYGVVLTDTDVVKPDVLFVSKDRYHIRTPANIQGPPTWWWRYCRPRRPGGTGAPSESCTHSTESGSTGS